MYTRFVMHLVRKFLYLQLALLGVLIVPASAHAERYMVALKDGSALSVQAVTSQPGVKDLGGVGSAAARLIDVPSKNASAIIRQISSSPAVRYVEPDVKIKGLGLPNDPFVQDSSQWWFLNVQASPAWDLSGVVGSPITVAVVDSGLLGSHEDLSGRVWTNPDETAGNGLDDDGNGKVDDINGWNWVDNNADTSDQSGHGTRVASIIASNANNSLGIAGIAPQSKIMPLRFLDANNEGQISDAIAALDYARTKGAKIVNNSWGYYSVSDPESVLYREALDRARAAGILVVSAAGNDGYNLDTKAYYPASYPQDNNLVVSAADSKDPILPSWANYGPRTVDVLAPGVDIKSGDKDNGYSLADGTSLSAPIVSGAAAWLWGQRPSASYSTIRSAITDHAYNISSLGTKVYKGAKLDLLSSWSWMKTAAVRPLNLTPPVASASNTNLACTTGTWQSGASPRFYYSWVLASTPTVPFASSAAPKLRDGLWGKSVVCKVTARNKAGSDVASSAAVTIPSPAPENLAPPVISGVIGVGRNLTCSPGKWAKDPTSFSYSWTLDGQAVAGNTTPIYTVSASDRGKPLVCTIKASNNSAADPPVLQEKTVSSKALSVTWLVDTTPPAAPYVSPPRTPTTLTKIPINVRGESNALFRCKIDSGAYGPCAEQTDTLAEGTHTLSVTQTDLAGNTSQAANVTWTIDLTSPGLPDMDAVFQPGSPPVTTGSASFTNSQTITVTFKNSEPGAIFQCKFDEEAFRPCTSPYTRTKLTSRKHTLLLKQTDPAGNTSNARTLEWTVDREPPAQPTFTHLPAASSTKTTDYIAFSGDGTSTFECAYDSSAESSYQACTSPYALNGMSIGTHTFNVRQVDSAKNKSVVKSHSWTVLDPDVTAPAPPVITTNPSGTTKLTTLQATWTGEAGAVSECLVDNDAAGYKNCTSPLTLANLTEGAHSLKIRQVDSAGNVGSPAEATWTVDLTAPSAPSFTSKPGLFSNDSTPTFVFSGENGATFRCAIDNNSFAAALAATTCSSPWTSAALAAGSHTVYIWQTDQAGNNGATPASYTWTVDLTKPSVSSSTVSPTTTPSNSDSLTYTFQFSEPVDGLASADIGNLNGWTVSSITPSGEPVSYAGTDYYTAWDVTIDVSSVNGTAKPSLLAAAVSDRAGNVNLAYAATPQIVLDHTAPAAPSITQYANPSNAASPTIAFTLSEAGGSVECKLDAGSWGSCTSISGTAGTFVLSSLAEGSHTVSVRQTDAAGNTSAVDAMTWVVDLTVPDAPTLSGSPASYKNTTTAVTITFGSSETSPTFSYSLNGGTTWSAYSSAASYTFSAQANGSTYRIKVRQKDQAGNVSTESSEVSWVVDTGAPSAPSITQLTTPTNATAAAVSFAAAETGGSVECKLDSGTWGDCDSYDSASKAGTLSLTGLSEGSHTVSVRQTDTAGNVGATGTMTWVVDLTVPLAPTVTQLTTPNNSATASAAFVAAETGGTVQCKLDSGAWGSCTSFSTTSRAGTLSLTGLSEGSHTVSVRQTDAAGNVGATGTMTWVVDLTAPSAPAVDQLATPTNATTAAVTFTASETGGTVQCKLDSGAWGSCTSFNSTSKAGTLSLASLAAGSHTVSVRQTDTAGNVGATGNMTWVVDLSAPSAPTVTQLTTPTNATTAAIVFTASETGGAVQCKLDSGTWGDCDSYDSASKAGTLSLTGLAEGSHTVSVRQTDAAGNVGATGTMTWVVDLTAPSAPSVTQLATPTLNTTASVTFTSAETGGTVQCKLDSGAWGSCTSFNTTSRAGTLSLTGLAEGSHTVSVRQTDAAGNVGATGTMTWVVDLTAPDVPTLSGVPSAYTNSTSAATVSVANPEANATFSYSLNSGSTWSAYSSTSSYTFSTQSNGSSYKIRWRQKDQAGNVATMTSDASWTVDTIAPSAPTLSGAPSAYTSSPSASITIAGETGATFTCSVDGGAYSPCASPRSLVGLFDGAHSLAVKQIDQAGNISASATTVSWTVDTQAPAAPSLTGPSGTTQNTAGTAAWTGETNAQFASSTDGGATWSSWSSTASKAYSAMTAGSYTLQVKQKDQAGNESATSSLSWTVQAPTISSFTATTAAGSAIAADGSTLLSSDTSDAQTVKFSLTTAATPLTATECQIDGGSWASCSQSTNVSSSLTTGTKHTLAVRITTSAGTSTTSSVEWKIMPTLTFDNTRGISAGTNNGASTFNVEDPKDTQASNPTSYPVYYTSNADANITGTPSYQCERWIGYVLAGTTSSCTSGTSLSTGSLTYSASGNGDMTVYVQATIGGAKTNKLTQRIHAYAPYPTLTLNDAAGDSYTQLFTGFSYTITNGTASSCNWRKYDTGGTMVGTVPFSYGCPNSGAGGTQTVVTNGYFPECPTCWDATNKGAAMQITALPQDGRAERSVTAATDDWVTLGWVTATDPGTAIDGIMNGVRWRRTNAWEFTRYGGTTNAPANWFVPSTCYNSTGRTAGGVDGTQLASTFTSSYLLLMNAACSGTYRYLYYGSIYILMYNWGDDVTFQAKLSTTYGASSGASAIARLSTESNWSSALTDIPFKSEMPATALQSSSAYKTCKLPQNESTIGSYFNLYLYARNATAGSGGAYFKAFSSTGSRTGTAANPTAGSCA